MVSLIFGLALSPGRKVPSLCPDLVLLYISDAEGRTTDMSFKKKWCQISMFLSWRVTRASLDFWSLITLSLTLFSQKKTIARYLNDLPSSLSFWIPEQLLLLEKLDTCPYWRTQQKWKEINSDAVTTYFHCNHGFISEYFYC